MSILIERLTLFYRADIPSDIIRRSSINVNGFALRAQLTIKDY